MADELLRFENGQVPEDTEWNAFWESIEEYFATRLRFRGDYSDDGTYEFNDVTRHEDAYWHHIGEDDSLAVEPGTDPTVWAVLGGGSGTADNASTTTKGITKLSTAPDDPAEPIAVGTNDPRLADTGVVAGDYTLASVSVGADGRITEIDSGVLPAASGSQSGTMSSADYNKLFNATSDATASTLAMRDADGRLKVADPSADGDAVNKGYLTDALNDLEIDGAPLATEAVNGIAKLSVAAVDPGIPIVVGDNDPRLDAFTGAGASHAAGLVPDPGATENTTDFLRRDGTWAAPTASDGPQAAHAVKIGPTAGADAVPTYRALVASDIPALDAAKVATGQLATARLGSGTASSTSFLRGDGLWATIVGTIASVTGLGMFLRSDSSIPTTGPAPTFDGFRMAYDKPFEGRGPSPDWVHLDQLDQNSAANDGGIALRVINNAGDVVNGLYLSGDGVLKQRTSGSSLDALSGFKNIATEDYVTAAVVAGGGASDFTDLGDVPASYAGEGGKLVAVNTGATALEFIDGGSVLDRIVCAGGEVVVSGGQVVYS